MKKCVLILLVLVGVLNASDCISNGNGTVSCSDSGLVWQDNSVVGTFKKNWQEAISYCEGLILAGHNDWRLPNITELKSITDRANKIDPSLKDGFTQRSIGCFWSSTSRDTTSAAWYVGFDKGGDFSGVKGSAAYVRCTR